MLTQVRHLFWVAYGMILELGLSINFKVSQGILTSTNRCFMHVPVPNGLINRSEVVELSQIMRG